MRRAGRSARSEYWHDVPLNVRKNYPLRLDAEVLDAVRRWADDDLRSLNGQIEFLLREALRRSGRLSKLTNPSDGLTNSSEGDDVNTA
jgi:hypothetical protein